jgi:hypothetical protein
MLSKAPCEGSRSPVPCAPRPFGPGRAFCFTTALCSGSSRGARCSALLDPLPGDGVLVLSAHTAAAAAAAAHAAAAYCRSLLQACCRGLTGALHPVQGAEARTALCAAPCALRLVGRSGKCALGCVSISPRERGGGRGGAVSAPWAESRPLLSRSPPDSLDGVILGGMPSGEAASLCVPVIHGVAGTHLGVAGTRNGNPVGIS